MGRITLQQAAEWCGGKIDPKYKDITFLGANNDTLKLQTGELFVALKGARDGHDFIPAALEKVLQQYFAPTQMGIIRRLW